MSTSTPVERSLLSTDYCLLTTVFHDGDPLTFPLFAEDDAAAEEARGLFEFGAAVGGVEEGDVVLGLARGGALKLGAEEVLDGDDLQRAARVAIVRVAQLVRRGPRREHARARVLLFEEVRGVAVEQDEVAVGEILLPGE